MSDIKIQQIKKNRKGEFLADQLFRLLDEFLGPVFLAFAYYMLLWVTLILFCRKEMAEILGAILTGRIDWPALCGCSAKIVVCAVIVTFMYRRAIHSC